MDCCRPRGGLRRYDTHHPGGALDQTPAPRGPAASIHPETHALEEENAALRLRLDRLRSRAAERGDAEHLAAAPRPPRARRPELEAPQSDERASVKARRCRPRPPNRNRTRDMRSSRRTGGQRDRARARPVGGEVRADRGGRGRGRRVPRQCHRLDRRAPAGSARPGSAGQLVVAAS